MTKLDYSLFLTVILIFLNPLFAVYISDPNSNIQENELVNTTGSRQSGFKSEYEPRVVSNFGGGVYSSKRDVYPMQQWPVVNSGPFHSRDVRADPLASSRSNIDPVAVEVTQKQAELQQLLQQLYQAEADVQMQAAEVTRIQQSAAEAIQQLEDATNKARMLSADLQAAQEEAANAAMRAHTAQLQLAAHDHLMFAARQRVDSLSAQMLTAQAELATVQQVFTLNASTHHLEDQGKISVAFNIPPYGQVYTNSGQLTPEVMSPISEPVVPVANLDLSNTFKNPRPDLSPLANVASDYGNAVNVPSPQRSVYSRDKPSQKMIAEYPKAKEIHSRHVVVPSPSVGIKADSALQDDTLSFIDELQKRALDSSVSARP